MKHLFSILFFLSCASFLSAQVPQVALKDILEFKIDTTCQKIVGWLAATDISKIQTRVENDTLKKNKSIPVFSFPATENGKSFYRMVTGFLMPDIYSPHDIKASFICKNQGFDTVQLIFTGYNTDGNIISIDTLKMERSDGWHESTMTFHIGEVSFMHLALEMEGSTPNIDKTLWLDKIQLKIGGIDLAEYPPRNLDKKYTPDIKAITKLSFENPDAYKQIEMLATKKMVALGESLHGSETLKESAMQIMKHRVLYNNCKLILLEASLEQALAMNRFVQGDERFDLETVAENLEFSLYSKNILDFLIWLREYNRSAERKVFVLGMDAPGQNHFIFTTELFNYFYRTNKAALNHSIKEFLKLILTNSRKAMGPVLSSLKENVDFKNNNDSLEIKIIEHWWSDWLKYTPNTHIDINPVRDSIMYSSAKFMTDLLCAPSETVTLCSHIEHACCDKMHTISQYPPMSYGSLLKKDLGDDYCALGLFAFQGEVLSVPDIQQVYRMGKQTNFIKQVLEQTPMNGMERLLYKSGYDYLYIPAVSLPNSHLYIRLASNSQQIINIIHPSHYMDGVIYVKDSKATQIINPDTSLYTKNEKIMKRFSEYESMKFD